MKALVRRPGSNLADGIVTHIDRTPIDVGLALAQWHAYVAAMTDNGWQPIEVDAAVNCPDSVFVEDTMVVYDRTAVIARSAARARWAETAAAEAAVAGLGYDIAHIEAPGTLDGGDVLKVAGTVYVGQGGRTNEAGLRSLRSVLEPLGATVVGVPISVVLHLKSAVTALPDGTIVGYPPLVENPALFPRFLPVPEESGAHVVLLEQDKLLMAADAPRSAELFARLGWTPIQVDISEFEKLEGCVTCLSVRLRGLE